jgi:hypothetical protein
LVLLANGANAQPRTGNQPHVRHLPRIFGQARGYAPHEMPQYVYGSYSRPSNNNLNPDFQLGRALRRGTHDRRTGRLCAGQFFPSLEGPYATREMPQYQPSRVVYGSYSRPEQQPELDSIWARAKPRNTTIEELADFAAVAKPVVLKGSSSKGGA